MGQAEKINKKPFRKFVPEAANDVWISLSIFFDILFQDIFEGEMVTQNNTTNKLTYFN